jgi:hypothetical protein
LGERREKLLKVEKEVLRRCQKKRGVTMQEGDFILGIWNWRTPPEVNAPILIDGKIRALRDVSPLIESMEPARYRFGRSKLVIGVSPSLFKDKELEETIPYAGKYRGERELSLPIVTPRDRDISAPSTRTSSLIQWELENYRRELMEIVDRTLAKRGIGADITESDIRMVKIPKKRIDLMEWILGGIGLLFIGWGVSIIVEGKLDY